MAASFCRNLGMRALPPLQLLDRLGPMPAGALAKREWTVPGVIV